MGDFLNFRKFITPLVIQILFWLGVALAVIGALYVMLQGGVMILVGLFLLILWPLGVRIYCELLILLFRIYDELVAMRTGVPPQAQAGFEIFPSSPAPPAGGPPPGAPGV